MVILRFLYRVYRTIFFGFFYFSLIRKLSFFRPIHETKLNESPNDLRGFFRFRLTSNKGIYWPVHKTSKVVGSWRNVYVGIDAAPGISPGCYIQAVGKIYIGDYAQVAPNVGLISSNHFMLDIRKHVISEIRIGRYCRIGMGSIILPGVCLGDFTTVSAGSIVTKSFPQGYCVLQGNPAQIVEDYSLKESIKKKFVEYKNEFEYNGYIHSSEFKSFVQRELNFEK